MTYFISFALFFYIHSRYLWGAPKYLSSVCFERDFQAVVCSTDTKADVSISALVFHGSVIYRLEERGRLFTVTQ